MKKTNLNSKNRIGFALIYAVLLGVFNLLVFTIFKTRTDVFWLSYAFMTLAFVVQIVSMLLAFKTADVETMFFGIPLASFSIYYLGAALVIGALFMIFQAASFTLALVIQILVLAAFVIIAVISLMSRNTVKEINDNVKDNVASLRSLLVDVETVRDSCSDPELKESLRKLSETIKYSDPMTNESVAGIEEQIRRKISELRVTVDDGQTEDSGKVCAELERLFVERNRKLLASK